MAITMRLTMMQNRLPALKPTALQMVRQAIAETMVQVETDAKVRAPVDTGTMRASITAQFEGPTAAVVGTGPQAPYAIFVHDGTRRRAPRPFLRQAAEAARPFWTARLRSLLRGLR